MTAARLFMTDAAGVTANLYTADEAERMPQPSRFGSGTAIRSTRIARVQAALAAGDPVTTAAYADLLSPPAFAVSQPAFTVDRIPAGPNSNPFLIPAVAYGEDPGEGAAAVLPLRYDGISAYDFALQYLITGNATFAESAARQLDPWTALTGFIGTAGGSAPAGTPSGPSTRLNWSFQFPTMVAAASMIRTSAAWTSARETAFTHLVNMSILPGYDDPASYPADTSPTLPGSIGYSNTNNQGDYGTLLNLACAAYLGRRDLFDAAVARWKFQMDASIDQNGDLWQEVHRSAGGLAPDSHSGLHYQLLAFAAKVRSAEIARANGVWLYDYEAPPTPPRIVTVLSTDGATEWAFTLTGGGSLKKLWDRLMPWLAAQTYPYFTPTTDYPELAGVELDGDNIGWLEILQRIWPRPDAQAVLDAARPCWDVYGSMFLSLTYPNLPLRG